MNNATNATISVARGRRVKVTHEPGRSCPWIIRERGTGRVLGATDSEAGAAEMALRFDGAIRRANERAR